MGVGRPTEYNYQELKPLIDSYLLSCEDTDENKENGIRKSVKLPSIEGLCLVLGISKDTLYAWEKKHEEFSYDIDTVRQKQAERLLNKGLSGDYNPTIAKVLLTKHGYREGIDQTTNDKDLPTPILGNVSSNDIIKEDTSTNQES